MLPKTNRFREHVIAPEIMGVRMVVVLLYDVQQCRKAGVNRGKPYEVGVQAGILLLYYTLCSHVR